MKILGVDFAPLCIPMSRRRQTAAVAGWMTVVLFGINLTWAFLFWGIFYSSMLRIFLLLYIAWMYFDRDSIDDAPRRSEWVRDWRLWRDFAEYFPIRLVKTAEMPPDRSYIFAAFPHGVLSHGVFTVFATNACRFHQVFPGLTASAVTLNIHFVTPFIRELAHAMASIPSKERSIVQRLSKPGQAIGLVAGGAQEAYYSNPGEYNIIVNRRKGFVRIALQTGSSLVPTIAFGEPDVFHQYHTTPGSFLRWTQDLFKKLTGVAPVYLIGRGIFQYTYGLLPFRKPITVVAGSPIHVAKVPNPSKEEIDALHKLFCEKLTDLFNVHKKTYLPNSDVNLTHY